MNRYCLKVALLLVVVLLSMASCIKILEVEKSDWWTFSAENLLDENVIVRGSVKENQFSITLSPNESYTYTQDLMSGSIEEGKTPIFSATSIKIVGETVGSVEFQTESYRKQWVEESDHHLAFKITSSLFQTE